MQYQDEKHVRYKYSRKGIAFTAFAVSIVCILATTFIFIIFFELKNDARGKNIESDNSILDSGLILYYNFNNNKQYGEDRTSVHDFSGNGNNGVVSGADWDNTGGKLADGAFEFSSQDSIKVSDSDSLSPSSFGQYFTISFWIRFDETNFVGVGNQKDYTNFLGKGNSFGGQEFLFRQYNSSNIEKRNDRISFYAFNPSGGLGAGSYFQEIIIPGEWIYVTGVINGTNIKIYKNGALQGDTPLSDYDVQMENGESDFYIGKTTENNSFKGSIDELRMYNRALNDSQVQELYDFSMEEHK